MTDLDVEQFLLTVFKQRVDTISVQTLRESVDSLGRSGLDRGLVVHFKDGSEIRIIVAQARYSEEDIAGT